MEDFINKNIEYYELMNIYPKGVAMNYAFAIVMLQRKMKTF